MLLTAASKMSGVGGEWEALYNLPPTNIGLDENLFI